MNARGVRARGEREGREGQGEQEGWPSGNARTETCTSVCVNPAFNAGLEAATVCCVDLKGQQQGHQAIRMGS